MKMTLKAASVLKTGICFSLLLLMRTTTVSAADIYLYPSQFASADAFDSYMRTVSPGTIVHLSAGRFETKGLWIGGQHNRDKLAGWIVQPDCTIVGVGTNLDGITGTTVKLVDVDTSNYENCVIGNHDEETDQTATCITISNLAIDCNAVAIRDAHPGSAGKLSLSGVDIRGVGSHVISNILVVNAVGRNSGRENFIIVIEGTKGFSTWNLINNCTVADYQGGYCSAISLNRDFHNSGGDIEGTVQNCHVYLQGFDTADYGGQFAYNGLRMRNCNFNSNYAYGAARGYNNDSVWVENVSLQGNTFDVPPGYAYGFYLINGGRYSQVSNNTIHLGHFQNTGIFISGPVDIKQTDESLPVGIGSAEWLLASNQIQPATGYPGTAIGINLAASGSPWYASAAENVSLTGNSVNSAFANAVPATAGYMVGNVGSGFPTQPNPGWSYPSAPLAFPPTYSDGVIWNKGDMDADGEQDLVFTDGSSNMKAWLLDKGNPYELTLVSPGPSAVFAISPPNGNGFQVVATADINGDETADFWMQAPSGAMGYWLMNGGTMTSSGLVRDQYNNPVYVAPGWTVVGSADFGSPTSAAPDGHPDLLFQYSDNSLAVWFMNGTQWLTSAILSPSNSGPHWRAVGTGDFNRDGYTDILFQYDDPSNPSWNKGLAVWYMNHLALTGTAFTQPNFQPPSLYWSVAAVADFNLDHFVDIIFQDKSGGPWGGSLHRWLMDGVRTLNLRDIPEPEAVGAFNVVAPK
jgi:hypothetical protein